MGSKDELADSSQLPKEGQLIPKIEPIENELLDDLQDKLIPKIEPIDVDLIKKENFESEEFFVTPGIIESVKTEKDSVTEEILENVEVKNCSSSYVRNKFKLFYSFIFPRKGR